MTGASDLYKYRARLVQWEGEPGSWHDGDTFAADVDLGARVHLHCRVRTAGYNSPEINRLATREAATAARVYAEQLAPLGSVVYVDSLAFEAAHGTDNFARLLGYVTLPDGRDLAATMISAGHAIPA